MADQLGRIAAALAEHYRVEREIGAGGMATVYLAEDLKHHRRVAVKVLRPDLAASLGPERFLREIEVAARLTHPHILPLLDSGEAGGFLYYVMPFVEGQSLRARITRDRELPINEAVRLVRDVVDALAHAHAHGVVHRDIKPDNVLVADRHALVTDFGVAKAISEATGRQQLTTAGVALGTPAYMAPEQAAADPHVDHRADIYAVGAMAYELMTGAPPFAGPTPQAVLAAHLTEAPEPVSRRRVSVPPPLESVIMRCLEKRPADRWQSAGELLDAIENVTTPTLGTTPAGTAPVTAVPRQRRWIAGAAAGAAGLVALSVVLWRGRVAASEDGMAPAARPLGDRPWVIVAAFDGTGGDNELRSATQALVRAALDQSELVITVPPDELAAALRAAGRAETTGVTNALARELAVRNEVAHVVQGRVDQLGNELSILLHVVTAQDGRVAATASGTAAETAELVPRIAELVAELTPTLGGNVVGRRAATDLLSAMTPSFEAFKLWREGVDLYGLGDGVAARAMFRQALALDPDFASAWAYVGHTFWVTGPQDSANISYQRALARPDRLSPGSRLSTQALLALNRNDVAGALAMFEQLDRQGRPWYHNHGLTLVYLRRHQEAAETYRRALQRQLRPSPLTLNNLSTPLFRTGAFDEARQVFRQLDSMSHVGAPLRALTLASLDGDWDRLEQQATALRDDPGTRPGWRFEAARTAAGVKFLRGQVSAALRDLERAGDAADAADQTADSRLAVGISAVQSWYLEGRARPEANLDPADTVSLAATFTRAIRAATVGDTTAARRLAARLRARPEHGDGRMGASPEFIDGVIAAQGGRWREVLDRLRPAAARGDGGDIGRLVLGTPRIPRLWLVAEAYRRLGVPDSAAIFFERVADLKGSELEVRYRAELYPFVHRRLAQVYGEMGQRERARDHWNRFLEVFTNPDPEFADMVTEGKAALARLSREP
jgi:serine/threonine-protein kinase